MKKTIIFIAILAFGIDTKELLKEINILKNTSFEYKEIEKIYNPFIQKNKNNIYFTPIKTINESIKQKNYNLEVIFQNRVRINNTWYKNGDKLDEYIIIIKNNKVYLKKGKKLILLHKKSLIKVQ